MMEESRLAGDDRHLMEAEADRRPGAAGLGVLEEAPADVHGECKFLPEFAASAASDVSPAPTLPPGNSQAPGQAPPGGRRQTRKRSPRRMTAATTSTGVRAGAESVTGSDIG